MITQTLLKKKVGGRVAALEIMTGTTAVRNLIREGKIHQIPGTMQVSQKDGMQTMDMALTNLVTRGIVTPRRGAIEKHEPESFRRCRAGSGVGGQSLIDRLKNPMDSSMDIQELFKTMVEMEASDLYLTVARPPMYRVDGKIQPGGEHAFTPEELQELARVDDERKTAA